MLFARLNKFRHTLTFRLTLWYAGLFTLSSCIAFLMFYYLIASVISERIDQELTRQINHFSTILSIRGIEAVKDVAVLEAQGAGEKKVFYRLLTPSGEIFSSSNMSYWRDINVDAKAIRRLLEGRPNVYQTRRISSQEYRVRIAYGFIGEGLILQLGQSMESYDRLIETFRRIFIVTMAILFVAAALLGGFMARRALAGVAAVTRTAKRITGEALDQRVPLTHRGDEVDELAATFNAMLDRIRELVTGIREMSDNIAHDLKSPVTRIRGQAEVTLTTNGGLADYEAMAASTIEECDRLLDMINTMLMISKTESGVVSLNTEPVNMGDLVANACDLLAPMAEDKQLTLDVQAAGDVRIDGDQRMLQRMVANLLDNAIQYTPPGGDIRVRLEKNGRNGVLLEVADTGVGIDATELPRIFERFYRCDHSRSTNGTGLGLSFARATARAHNGDIQAVSEPGKGSRFKVILPGREGDANN